jgi:hypothetical protein
MADLRECDDCGNIIPPQRVEAIPNVTRCVRCQTEYEKRHDTKAHINEGIAGTREENKRLRGQLQSDIRKRGRER